ncbi:hypothetical protein [Streptosporangium sp. NPDC050280]|uniref:hypothetical protein n=1 Tax=unclassified Streptosporangium TaxID=2632669 RepID=UPI00341AF477
MASIAPATNGDYRSQRSSRPCHKNRQKTRLLPYRLHCVASDTVATREVHVERIARQMHGRVGLVVISVGLRGTSASPLSQFRGGVQADASASDLEQVGEEVKELVHDPLFQRQEKREALAGCA